MVEYRQWKLTSSLSRMLQTFHSTATSGQLGLAHLHGGRGLILHGILGDITGGPIKLIDPYGDFLYGSSDSAVRLSTRDFGIRVFELEIAVAPTTASWLIFYGLW